MSSNVNWVLKARAGVYKDLAKIPVKYREKILLVIESLAADPFAGDIEKMKGENNAWRRRVGDYRIFYELVFASRLVQVSRVRRRTSSTY